MSLDEKLDALQEDIGKLFGIVEELSHKQHVFTDAIQLLQNRLDEHDKMFRNLRKTAKSPELVD